jgi:anti-sigma regulatory factor (Ser/Thr protein kinase)
VIAAAWPSGVAAVVGAGDGLGGAGCVDPRCGRPRASGTLWPAMPPIGNPEDTVPAATSPPQARRLSERVGYRATSSESCRLLRLALPADPIAISVARHQVRRWLAALSWPAGQLDDIVLAVSEAVTNAIEHAYLDQPPGVVEVRGGIEATPDGQRRVTVIVRDHGRWRAAPIDDEHRRRGIPLMRACMDTVTIGQPDDGQVGTWVVLRSRAVSPQAPDVQDHDRPC